MTKPGFKACNECAREYLAKTFMGRGNCNYCYYKRIKTVTMIKKGLIKPAGGVK